MSGRNATLIAAVLTALGVVLLAYFASQPASHEEVAPTPSEEPVHQEEPRPPVIPPRPEVVHAAEDAGSLAHALNPVPPSGHLELSGFTSSAPADGGVKLSDGEVTRVIAAVTPLVQQCFDDLQGRYHEPFDAELAFSVDEAGSEDARIGRAEVSRLTVEDPFLRACLEDAPLDVKLGGREYGSVWVSVPFRYMVVGR